MPVTGARPGAVTAAPSRRRFVADDGRRRLLGAAALGQGTVLHDGGVCATWSVAGGTLVVRHDGPLPPGAAADIAAEGLALLRSWRRARPTTCAPRRSAEGPAQAG